MRRIAPPPSQDEVLRAAIAADITQAEATVRDRERQRRSLEEARAEIAELLTAYSERNAIDRDRPVEEIAGSDPEISVMIRAIEMKTDEIADRNREIETLKQSLSFHRARLSALQYGVSPRAPQATPGEALRREMTNEPLEHITLRQWLQRYAAER
jgi:chromosome segregation ATPase